MQGSKRHSNEMGHMYGIDGRLGRYLYLSTYFVHRMQVGDKFTLYMGTFEVAYFVYEAYTTRLSCLLIGTPPDQELKARSRSTDNKSQPAHWYEAQLVLSLSLQTTSPQG